MKSSSTDSNVCVELLATTDTSNSFNQDLQTLMREVYCVLGMPIDAIDMAATLHKINEAAATTTPFLFSTANLNFLGNSLKATEFRESLLLSDLITPDGTPIIWIAQVLGLPFKERIAGADILDDLRSETTARKLSVFLFGGADGAADLARRVLNKGNSGLTCVGALNPGYGSLDDMSSDEIITQINATKADFLIVALGAGKGQAWLQRNHQRLRIPVRAHLGAAINFQAGLLKRAPKMMREAGLEWLWRIKEEPYLWVRYWRDGRTLVRLLWTRVLPLACRAHLRRWCRPQDLRIDFQSHEDNVVVQVFGDATTQNINHAIGRFQQALALARPIMILDLVAVRDIDQRFFGLILMLRKSLHQRAARLLFMGVSDRVRRLFELNELQFLLDAN